MALVLTGAGARRAELQPINVRQVAFLITRRDEPAGLDHNVVGQCQAQENGWLILRHRDGLDRAELFDSDLVPSVLQRKTGGLGPTRRKVTSAADFGGLHPPYEFAILTLGRGNSGPGDASRPGARPLGRWSARGVFPVVN